MKQIWRMTKGRMKSSRKSFALVPSWILQSSLRKVIGLYLISLPSKLNWYCGEKENWETKIFLNHNSSVCELEAETTDLFILTWSLQMLLLAFQISTQKQKEAQSAERCWIRTEKRRHLWDRSVHLRCVVTFEGIPALSIISSFVAPWDAAVHNAFIMIHILESQTMYCCIASCVWMENLGMCLVNPPGVSSTDTSSAALVRPSHGNINWTPACSLLSGAPRHWQ